MNHGCSTLATTADTDAPHLLGWRRAIRFTPDMLHKAYPSRRFPVPCSALSVAELWCKVLGDKKEEIDLSACDAPLYNAH